MPQLLIALVILFGGYWLIKKAGRMQPSQAKQFGSRIVGGGALALAGLLAMRGSTQLAVPLFLFGLGSLGFSKMAGGGFKWPGERSTGQSSTVSTKLLSMELDHDSGEMRGKVLRGPFAGRALADLHAAELRQFHAQCGREDRQSLQLVEAWLDRYHAEWRAEWTAEERPRSSSTMTREEAFSVLGLKEGASDDTIRKAHRRLMKEYHPDMGGSDYLAAKINEAKDLLLGT